MALGRKAKLKKDGSVIAGIRTVTLSWSGESVDLTTGEDDGFRLLDALSGQEQIDISFEGISKDGDVFRDLVFSNGSRMLTDITIEFEILDPTNTTPASLTCDFRLSSYEEGKPYNDATTFSGTLESSGEWTYTAESA